MYRVASYRRVGSMRNHDQRIIAPQGTIREQILGPEPLPRLMANRQILVSIQVDLAQAREMLSATEYACFGEATQEFPNVEHGLFRLVGNSARTHYRTRSLKCQVRHRGKIRVEAQGTTFFTDHFAMLAEELGIVRGEYFRCGGCGFESFLQAINQAAFHVNAAKQRR